MLILAILATLLVSVVSLVGVAFLFVNDTTVKKAAPHLVGFAAGVMLSTALLDILPEALEFANYAASKTVLYFVLLGVVLFFVLERFLIWYHHHDEHTVKPATLLVIVGDSLHNFIDGVAIAAGFLVSPAVGTAVTWAIIAHEVPHELSDYTVLTSGGMSPKRALVFNLMSALTAVLGATIGYLFLSKVAAYVPYVLALSAGMFIYIACSDLIPDLHKEFKDSRGWLQTVPFVLGICVTVLLGTVFAH